MNAKGPVGGPAAPFHRHHPTPTQRRKLSVGGGAAPAVPPVELASAVAFLSETALQSACDILLAQSDELFGSVNGDGGSKQGGVKDAEEGSKNELVAEKPRQHPQQTTSEAADAQSNRPAESHINQLSSLYQKCKNAHDLIVRADEAGMLSDTSHGVAPPPIGHSGSFGPGAAHPSPHTVHRAASSGMIGVKPPPSLSRGISGSSTPSLLRSRGSFSGVGSGKTPMLHRKVHSDRHVGGGVNKAFHRGGSNGSEGAVGGHGGGGGADSRAGEPEKSANPPPEVLNFLKALNAGKGAVGGPEKMETIDEKLPSATDATPKKRKSPPPPPPPSHPPPPPKREKPAPGAVKANPAPQRTKAFTHVERAPPPPAKSALGTPASAPAQPTKTPESRSTRSRRSTPSSASTKSSAYKTYDIGESVLAMRDGEKRSAIVKNVHCGSDEEDEGDEGGSGDDVVYEVEFSDGEIWDVDPGQMFENEDD